MANTLKHKDIITKALGISVPWQVSEVKLDKETRRLTIFVDYSMSDPVSCPQCGQSEGVTYCVRPKTWQHLRFFQYETFISSEIPLFDCPSCGSIPITLPWAQTGKSTTSLFEASMQS
jgi:transposase